MYLVKDVSLLREKTSLAPLLWALKFFEVTVIVVFGKHQLIVNERRVS